MYSSFYDVFLNICIGRGTYAVIFECTVQIAQSRLPGSGVRTALNSAQPLRHYNTSSKSATALVQVLPFNIPNILGNNLENRRKSSSRCSSNASQQSQVDEKQFEVKYFPQADDQNTYPPSSDTEMNRVDRLWYVSRLTIDGVRAKLDAPWFIPPSKAFVSTMGRGFVVIGKSQA